MTGTTLPYTGVGQHIDSLLLPYSPLQLLRPTMATEQEVLTNEAIPRTTATLTIRIVKSFEFRTERHLILHSVNCEATTVGQLKELARQSEFLFSNKSTDCRLTPGQAIQTQSGWKPYRNVTLGMSQTPSKPFARS